MIQTITKINLENLNRLKISKLELLNINLIKDKISIKLQI